jgi:hypothetical protein
MISYPLGTIVVASPRCTKSSLLVENGIGEIIKRHKELDDDIVEYEIQTGLIGKVTKVWLFDDEIEAVGHLDYDDIVWVCDSPLFISKGE